MRGFVQHTLLDIIRSDVGRLHQWIQNNPFRKNNSIRKVEVSRISSDTAEANITSQTKSYGTAFPINLYKRATIRQISYSQTCTLRC
jgi:hypothetical protein